jgi:hypothetical protein
MVPEQTGLQVVGLLYFEVRLGFALQYIMRLAHSKRSRFRAPSLTLVTIALLLPPGASGGDKIQFSDTPKKVEIPTKDITDDVAKRYESLRSKSAVPEGFDAPASMYPTLNDPGLQQKLGAIMDKQKNWLFQAPGKVDQETALKEIFGVRSTEFGRGEGLSAAGSPSFSELLNRGKRPNGAEDSNKLSFDQGAPANGFLTSPSLGAALDPFGATTGLSGLGGNALNTTGAFNSLSTELQNFDLFGRQPGDPLSQRPLKPRSLENRSSEVNGFVDPARNVANYLGEPIAGQIDATRMEMNPVTGRAMESIFQNTTIQNANDIFGGRAGGGKGSRRIDPFSSTIFGGSSLSPSVVAPSAPTSVMERKPGVLEIPRRKF